MPDLGAIGTGPATAAYPGGSLVPAPAGAFAAVRVVVPLSYSLLTNEGVAAGLPTYAPAAPAAVAQGGAVQPAGIEATVTSTVTIIGVVG
jgi:hypothetical protein